MTSQSSVAFCIKNVSGDYQEYDVCKILRKLRITATDLKIERRHGEGTYAVSLKVASKSKSIRKIKELNGQRWGDHVLVVEQLEASDQQGTHTLKSQQIPQTIETCLESKSFPISLSAVLMPKQQEHPRLQHQLQHLGKLLYKALHATPSDSSLKPLIACLASDIMVRQMRISNLTGKQADHAADALDQELALLQQRLGFDFTPGDQFLACSTPSNPLQTWSDSGLSSDARTCRPPEQAEVKESSESSKSHEEQVLHQPRRTLRKSWADMTEEEPEEQEEWASLMTLPQRNQNRPDNGPGARDRGIEHLRNQGIEDVHSPPRRVHEPVAPGGADGKSASGSNATHSAGVTAACPGASGGAYASPLVLGLVQGRGDSAARGKGKGSGSAKKKAR